MKKITCGLFLSSMMFQPLACQIAETFEGNFVLNAEIYLEGTAVEIIYEP